MTVQIAILATEKNSSFVEKFQRKFGAPNAELMSRVRTFYLPRDEHKMRGLEFDLVIYSYATMFEIRMDKSGKMLAAFHVALAQCRNGTMMEIP